MSGRVPRSSRARQKMAARAYEEFTGHDADESVIVEIPEVGEAWVLGELTEVRYRTVRDGEEEFYKHPFRPESRPLLAVSHDGEQLLIVGGNYKVLDTGINDM